MADRVDRLQKVPFPEGGVLALQEGQQAVYYEPVGGTSTIAQPSQSAFLQAVDVIGPSGPVPERVQSANIQISAPGIDGYDMARIEVPADGEYRVVVRGEVRLAPGRIAIGERIFGAGGRTLILTIVGAGMTLLAVGGAMAIFFTRRGRRRSPDPEQLSSPGMEGLPPPPGEF